VVQQFVHWSQRSDAQVQRTYSHAMPFVKATALKASDIALKLQTVDDAATANIDEAPRQQSWVF